MEDLDLSGCTSLKSLYINQANTLPLLDIDECTSIESIILVNPQNLLRFETSSTTLKTLKFIGNNGSQNLITLSLNTPSLSTIEMTDNQNLVNLSLTNLPSAITDIRNILPEKWGSMTSRNVSHLSVTGCSGFSDISINPADHITEMHFDSCPNLQTVTLYGNNSTNVWNNPATTTVVATRRNCPNLDSTYTVNNYGTIKTFDFTDL